MFYEGSSSLYITYAKQEKARDPGSNPGGAIGFERPENSINSLSPRFLRTFGNPGGSM